MSLLNRGTTVLTKLIRAGLIAHAIGVADVEELPDEYAATVEAAARIWENGDELAFNAMVYALLFQASIDLEDGDN
ncbi:hypothetical protein [Streptosporangium sp. OZ121]|uniref:hypothetical protein n=1 Tax=Streptosporangium sp. OZ121 TaxID=3444183 RepID=UPI003F7AD1EE